MSQRYIACDGHNFSFASSGTRLIVSILTSLLDDEYSHFLVDEPELGISPEAQGRLANFLLTPDNREKFFPHVKALLMATHSTIFLDRMNIDNNYSISKHGDLIDVKQIESLSDFNRIHFYLLGNRLENLFLPSVVLFVEGPCEEMFFNRVFQVRYPGKSISIINATNDSEMKHYAHMLSQLFPELQNSPYRDRVIPVLDLTHGKGILDTLQKKGVSEDNVVIWSKNGIEYFYPASIMEEIFGGAGPLSIIGDEVSCKGQKYRKMDLARKVVGKITDDTVYYNEMEEKLFALIEKHI